MTFSGNPGETYPTRQVLAIAFGILKAFGAMSNTENSSFAQSLNQLEISTKEMLQEQPDSSISQQEDEIEYLNIMEQIDEMLEKDWSEGDVF